jgi:adenosylcobinamide-GDP ribazoletransferase
MVAVVLALLLRCVRRLGGITGDVLGAAVEVSLAVLVLAAATA